MSRKTELKRLKRLRNKLVKQRKTNSIDEIDKAIEELETERQALHEKKQQISSDYALVRRKSVKYKHSHGRRVNSR